MIDLGHSEGFQPIPHRIFEARHNLSPLNENNQALISQDNPIWREPLYPHEYSLMVAYIGMVERSKSNLKIQPEDKDNVLDFLRYAELLKETQVTIDALQERKIPPPLVQPKSKITLKNQIIDLSRDDFTQSNDWAMKMCGYLRTHIETLTNTGLLKVNDVSELDNKIERHIF